MSTSYEITTIRDMLKVPPERRADMLAELELALLTLELACGDEGVDDVMGFTWTDDGSPNVSLHDQEGQQFLGLEVKQ